MTIALLTDGIYPYVIGGMQRHSFYLAKYLAASGVMVDLYHTNQSEKDINELEGFSEDERKNIRSFVIEFPKFPQAPGHYIRESYEYSIRVWNIFRKERRPDFVIVKGFAGWELLNQKSKGVALPPIGLNFHGYEMFQRQPDFFSWIKSRLMLKAPVLFNVKNADYLFSYGGKITNIIKSLSVATDKIIEIPTGISIDWINDLPVKSGASRKFVFSGRHERRKGVKELGKILKEMIAEKRDFEFHFIGPIPKKEQIFSERIIYHDLISDNSRMKRLLREMEVLVCPSHSEGMPNVVMEGLASGLTVIATDTGATAVMVNEKNGWLISPGNKNELKDVMIRAIEMNSSLLDEKRRSAVTFVKENFLWEKIATNTIAAISEKIS